MASTASPYLDTPSSAAIIFPSLAILTLILDLPSLIWHVASRNIPASILVGWIMIDNLFNAIDAFIWPTDNTYSFWHGNGFCDVAVKLDVGGSIAKIACTLCIMRALARALDTNNPVIMESNARRMRQRVFECMLCIGGPMYLMVAHFIVQDRRYYILAITGCTPTYDDTWAAIPLVYIWPPIFCFVTAYYAVLVIFRLLKYKREFAVVLASSSSGLSTSRFLRLLGLSGVLLVIYLPVEVYILYYNSSFPLANFSWTRIHNPATWQTIILEPTFGSVQFDRWIRISLGFIVFACFGFGKDAKSIYYKAFERLGLIRFCPYLLVNRKHSDSGNDSSSRRRFLYWSSSTFGSGSLKGVARHVFSKMSLSSSRRTQHSTTSSSTAASVEIFSPKSISKPSVSSYCPTSGAAPATAFDRPTGLAEKELFDATSPSSTIVSPTLTLVAHPGVNNLCNVNLDTSQQHPQEHPEMSSCSRSAADLTHSTRSRFWQRLNTYVASMGPRPGVNMSVERGYSPERNGSPGRRVVPGAGATDFEAMRTRDYEAHVVGKLA